MSSKLLLIFAVLFTCSVVFANVVDFKNCGDETICKIHEVRVHPCSKPKKCLLKKGNLTSLSFDYTTNFSSDKMIMGLFWASDTKDYPFGDLDRAYACNNTVCPLEAGKKNELTYSLLLGKKLPSGTFPIKYSLWNPDNENEKCCFKIPIELRK